MRGIDTQRGMAAARAMESAGVELGGTLSAAVGNAMWARLVGSRGLQADDSYGRALGLVVQHDELGWADLLDALEVGAPLIEQLGHPLPSCAGGGCAVCRAVRALPRLRRSWLETGLAPDNVRSGQRLLGGAQQPAESGAAIGAAGRPG